MEKITAKKAGTATILVATHDGGYTDTCEVNVISKSYVVVTANATSKLLLSSPAKPDLQYSFDEITWTAYSTEIDINQGQNLYLKGYNPTGWSKGFSQYSTLSITGDVSISGNVMGLLDNGKGTMSQISNEYFFCNLFKDSFGITSISENFLPATTLAYGCYNSMFENCEKLKKAPDLPATTLAEGCYAYMFYSCTSLNSVKIGYTGNFNPVHFISWVSGVAVSGTFYYNGSDSLASFGFPSGWTKTQF